MACKQIASYRILRGSVPLIWKYSSPFVEQNTTTEVYPDIDITECNSSLSIDRASLYLNRLKDVYGHITLLDILDSQHEHDTLSRCFRQALKEEGMPDKGKIQCN